MLLVLAVIAVALVLAVGMSWSHVSRRLTGQLDTDEVNAVGGALSRSVIEGLYIQHTKVGIWLDGPGRDLLVRDNVIVDQMADGINIRKGWRNVRATNNFFRNTGDDAMAMWSNVAKDVGNLPLAAAHRRQEPEAHELHPSRRTPV